MVVYNCGVKEKKETEMKCPFGCIFDGDKLMGDCRIPWSKDCALNKKESVVNAPGHLRYRDGEPNS